MQKLKPRRCSFSTVAFKCVHYCVPELCGCLHERNKAQGSVAFVRDPVSLSIVAKQDITCLNRVGFIAIGVGTGTFVDVVHLVVALFRVHADRATWFERDARYIGKFAVDLIFSQEQIAIHVTFAVLHVFCACYISIP